MRAFRLFRREDHTGISGTGTVAEGIEFSDGTVVLRWTTKTPTTELLPNMDTLIYIHGHGDKTLVEYQDVLC